MGETKTHHFYDFGISGRVHTFQKQLILSLETPGHLNKSRIIFGLFLCFITIVLENQRFYYSRKGGRLNSDEDPSNTILKILDMRSISPRKHGMDILSFCYPRNQKQINKWSNICFLFTSREFPSTPQNRLPPLYKACISLPSFCDFSHLSLSSPSWAMALICWASFIWLSRLHSHTFVLWASTAMVHLHDEAICTCPPQTSATPLTGFEKRPIKAESPKLLMFSEPLDVMATSYTLLNTCMLQAKS